MEQSSFNSIQNNFRKFLKGNLHPVVEPKKSPPVHNLNQRVERMEKTNVFGKDDCEIGYKISVTDCNGKRTTKIVAPM